MDAAGGEAVLNRCQPNVLRAFSLYTAIAFLIASAVVAVMVWRNVDRNSQQKVGEHTRFAASAVIPDHLGVGEWRKPLSGAQLRRFDAIVKRDLMTGGVLRVQLYNTAGVTIYSTDRSQIGKPFDNPAGIRKVLDGSTFTDVEQLNHAGSSGKDHKTFEAYAPVYYPNQNRAVGALEFYVDYGVAAGAIRKEAVPLTIFLLLVLLGFYFTLLPVLRRTTRALAFSNRELRRHADKLNEALQVQTTIEKRLRMMIENLKRSEDQLAQSQEETILRLSIAVESRDAETGSHIARMGRYCELLAEKLGWDQDDRELLRIASPLHDVGKIAIPDSVLQKPGALTANERLAMQEHAVIGYRILAGSDSPLLDLAARIAMTHHEKWDGSGYPKGLAGEEIPIEGRIAAVADVFDALTSDRVYRPAMPLEKAFAILTEGHGTHFDPKILDVFFASIDEVVAIRNGTEAAPEQIRDGTPKRRRRARGTGRATAADAGVASTGDEQQSLVG